MHTYLLGLLVCPACHNDLDWRQLRLNGDRIASAEAYCAGCGATYPVREEIGIFLTPDLPRDDLWEQSSGLTMAIKQRPDLGIALLEAPLESLNPADQFFRSMVLEERGNFDAARLAHEAAISGLYTADYQRCWQSQVDYLLSRIADATSPILDLASGRGYLVERLIPRTRQPIIASDFSPRVLRRDRLRWQHFGLYDRLSLLCFDARRTPFRDGAINLMTTNLGLPNIEQPDLLVSELRRVLNKDGGRMLAISHFYPETNDDNQTALREAGLEVMLTRALTLAAFQAAGWEHIELVNGVSGKAQPTPDSVVLGGARIDGFPVAETELEWGVLAAR